MSQENEFINFKFKTAGFTFDASVRFEETKNLCKKFIVADSEPADFKVVVSKEILEDLIEVAKEENERNGIPMMTGERAYRYYEFLSLHKLVSDLLPTRDAVMLHCSSVCVDGNAYLFTAPSGTGKSTHAALWQKLLGERMTYINDDKPFIKKVATDCEGEAKTCDGASTFKLYACGSPWCGKHRRGENIMAPIKAIGIICRDEKNFTKKVEPMDAFVTLYKQTYLPREDKAQMVATIAMMKDLAELVPMYEIHCNMDIEAAEVAFNNLGK